jgi:hypothetical protein
MFVVGTVQRVANSADSSKFDLAWPVVFEDDVQGFVGGVVAQRPSRDTAEKMADDLNKVLQAD